MSTPKQTIENILKIRFLMGHETSGLPPDTIAALKDKLKILEDAAKLASEVNTEKLHFILELVQNADDNRYEDGVTPRIKFIVKEGELLIQNNEIGFEKDHVWALCGVGETTKTNKAMLLTFSIIRNRLLNSFFPVISLIEHSISGSFRSNSFGTSNKREP